MHKDIEHLSQTSVNEKISNFGAKMYLHSAELNAVIFSLLLSTPRGCATASVGEYVPDFFPLGFWVFVSGGAREQLASVALCSDIFILFFSYDVELCMIFGRH